MLLCNILYIGLYVITLCVLYDSYLLNVTACMRSKCKGCNSTD